MIYLDENDIKLIKNTTNYQYVSNTNKIKNLDVHGVCTLLEIQMISNLFLRLESFQIGILKREIEPILRLLLSETSHLYFLCLYKLPKSYLRKVNMFIKAENLLNNYSIKMINQDLYLWW